MTVGIRPIIVSEDPEIALNELIIMTINMESSRHSSMVSTVCYQGGPWFKSRFNF